MKKFFEYLKSLPQVSSENSTKLFSLLISAVAGAFLAGVIIPFILVYDVLSNGFVRTDLTDLAIFLIADGAFIFGAGAQVKVNNIISDIKKRGVQDSENPYKGKGHMSPRNNKDE